MRVENNKIVCSFAFQAANEPLANGVGSGSLGRCFDCFDIRAFENVLERVTRFAVIVMNEIFRSFSLKAWLPELAELSTHQ